MKDIKLFCSKNDSYLFACVLIGAVFWLRRVFHIDGDEKTIFKGVDAKRAKRKTMKYFLAFGHEQSQNIYDVSDTRKDQLFEGMYKRSLEELGKRPDSGKREKQVSWKETQERRGEGKKKGEKASKVDLQQRWHMEEGSGEMWDQGFECSLVSEFLFHNEDR